MITWDVFTADSNGERSTPLPGVLELTWSNDDDEPGGGTLVYSLHDDFADTYPLLIGTTEICLILDGDIHPASANFELREPVKETLNPETGKPVEITYAFTSLLQRFEEVALVWPAAGHLTGTRQLTGTGIAIMNAAINDAQARGALADMTKDFGNLLDSDGLPHDPATYLELTVESGWTLLDLWRTIRDRRAGELIIRKHIIRMFNYGTKGPDFTPVGDEAPAFILEAGRDLISGTRKADLRNIRNVVRVEGSDGRWALGENAGSIIQYGRREKVLNASDVTDTGTLQAIADLAADQYANPIPYKGYEVRLAFDNPHDAPHPYHPDWTPVCGSRVAIRDDDAAAGIQYGRVANVKTTIDRTGAIRCWIAVDTRRASAEARRDWQIEQLQRGLPAAPIDRHRMAPAAPTTLTFTTGTEVPGTGGETAWLQPAWVLPSTDADGAPLLDLARMEARWRIGTARWRVVQADAGDTNARITGLPLGKSVDVQVYAVDDSNNYSAPLAGTYTTAVGTGQYRATDTGGAETFRVATDTWHATKVPGGALLRGGDGVGLFTATGPGIDLDSDVGVRLFDPAGSPAIWLDTTGDASFAGGVEILGTLDVSGTTTLGGDLTITTGTGNIVIQDDTITLGTATMSFSGSTVIFSAGVGVGGALSVTGTTTLNSTVTINADLATTGWATIAGAGAGVRVGFFGNSGAVRRTVTGSRGGNAALADLLDKLVSYNLIINSTSA